MKSAQIKESLKKSGLSQSALADAIGLDLDKLNKSLNGHRRWQVEEIQAIEAYFKTGLAPIAPDGSRSIRVRARASEDLGEVLLAEATPLTNDRLGLLFRLTAGKYLLFHLPRRVIQEIRQALDEIEGSSPESA